MDVDFFDDDRLAGHSEQGVAEAPFQCLKLRKGSRPEPTVTSSFHLDLPAHALILLVLYPSPGLESFFRNSDCAWLCV